MYALTCVLDIHRMDSGYPEGALQLPLSMEC